VPFRGDYYDLVPQAHHKINHLVYPVPDPAFPFLGVHFTRMIQGGVECGPNAVFAWAREQYTKTGFSLSDAADALTYAGTWRLFARHWRKGWGEYQRAFSKKQFLQALRVLMPQLQMEDIEPARAGIRAMALDASGNMSDDFVFMDNQRVLHVLNAPSPAATAGLAIGMEIASRMK
jgi:L-2-hydroxyglutarate oxidase